MAKLFHCVGVLIALHAFGCNDDFPHSERLPWESGRDTHFDQVYGQQPLTLPRSPPEDLAHRLGLGGTDRHIEDGTYGTSPSHDPPHLDVALYRPRRKKRHEGRLEQAKLSFHASACAYPVDNIGMNEGSTMPNFRWRRSFGGLFRDGTFSLWDIYCGEGPGSPDEFIVFVFGTHWCPQNVDVLKSLNEHALWAFGSHARIIYVEVGRSQAMHEATIENARNIVTQYAPEVDLIGVGDLDNVEPLAASRTILTVPTLMLVERTTMKILIRSIGRDGLRMIRAFLMP